MHYLRLFWGPRAFRATRLQNGVATVWSITKNVSKVTFKLNTAEPFHDRRSYLILLKQSFRVIVFLIFKDYILYKSKVLAFSEVRQCMFWKIRKTDISVRKRLEPLSRRRQKERTIRGTIEPKKMQSTLRCALVAWNLDANLTRHRSHEEPFISLDRSAYPTKQCINIDAT